MKLVPEKWLENYFPNNKINNIVKELPGKFQSDARNILACTKVTIEDNGQIRYDDGTTGSDITDMLKYFLYPKSKKVERPYDSDRFYELMLKSDCAPTALLDSINMTSVPQASFKWKSYV